MVLAGRLPPAAMFPAGRPELRTKYLDLASGIRVRAVECGDHGAPMVVLLHGWGCSVYVFRENLAPLAAAGFHAIAVDLKGHGLSDKPTSAGEYGLDAMRLHVTEILDALDANDVMLAGLSMGAALAAHVATAQPGRVRAVVMGSPVGFDGIPGLWAIRGVTPRLIAPLLPRIAARAVIVAILRIVTGTLRRTTTRDVDEYWAPTQFPEFTVAMHRLLHEFNWRATFTPLGIPCLLISGTRDPLLPRPTAKSYRTAAPGVRHIEIQGAGHVVYEEAPLAVNEMMIEFLRVAGKKGI